MNDESFFVQRVLNYSESAVFFISMILRLSSLKENMHPFVKFYNIVTGSHLIHGHKKTLLPTQSGVWIFTIYLCIP